MAQRDISKHTHTLFLSFLPPSFSITLLFLLCVKLPAQQDHSLSQQLLFSLCGGAKTQKYMDWLSKAKHAHILPTNSFCWL